MPNPIRCEKYCNKGDNWKYYHQPFIYSSDANAYSEMIEQIKQVIRDILLVKGKDSIVYSEFADDDSRNNKMSIHFQPELIDIAAKNEFNTLLSKELRLCNLQVTGNMQAKRNRLYERIKLESDLCLLELKYEHSTADENSYYCTADACTCILYIENRVNITFLEMLFIEGYSNCDEASLYLDVGRSVKARFTKYASDIAHAINTQILGDEPNLSQFRFPLNEAKDNIGTLCINNPTAQKIVDNIDILIDITCTYETRKTL